MSQSLILMNNHFIIIPDDSNLDKEGLSNSIFKPNKQFHSIKSFKLPYKQKNVEIVIIDNPSDNLSITNDINFEINNGQKQVKSEKYEPISTTSSDNINDNISIEIKNIQKEKKIFDIKRKKKIGRKPKTSNARSVHTKFSSDNILRKIKVKFMNKIVIYINKIILFKYHKKIKLFKKLTSSISQNNGISYNQKLLKSKLKEIFKENEMNGKYKGEKNYNQSVIDKIYEENITELIDILETTYLDAFNTFRDMKSSENFNGLENINKVIEEIQNKEKDDEYINKFKYIVMNFEKYYFDKIGRK